MGIAVCVVFTAWATFTSVELPALGRTLLDLGSANYDLNPKLIGVFSSLLLLGVGLPASILLGGGRRESEELTIWSLIRGRGELVGAWSEPGRAGAPAKVEVVE